VSFSQHDVVPHMVTRSPRQGSQNSCSLIQKDFCNTICQEEKIAHDSRTPATAVIDARAVRNGDCQFDDICAVTCPEARYARSGDFSITYQVMGEGPIEAYVCRLATDTFDGDARGLPRLRPAVNRRSRVSEQQPCAARSGMAGSGCQRRTAG
jgi:hypothetical protein